MNKLSRTLELILIVFMVVILLAAIIVMVIIGFQSVRIMSGYLQETMRLLL
jgi:hypothetical protein